MWYQNMYYSQIIHTRFTFFYSKLVFILRFPSPKGYFEITVFPKDVYFKWEETSGNVLSSSYTEEPLKKPVIQERVVRILTCRRTFVNGR